MKSNLAKYLVKSGMRIGTWFFGLLVGIGAQTFLASGQESDTIRTASPGWFVSIRLAPASTAIHLTSASALFPITTEKGSGGSLAPEVGYFFTEHFGLATGLNFMQYNGVVRLSSYQEKFQTTDSENESYERRVTAVQVSENQKIGLLGIPLKLVLRSSLGQRVGLLMEGQVSVAFPVAKHYTSSGIFTYKGYYPKYNVLLENLPLYGFPNAAAVEGTGDLPVKSPVISVGCAAGLDYRITSHWLVVATLHYDRSISQVVDTPASFNLSTDVTGIHSMMGGCTQASLQAIGVGIGIRYFPGRR
ncbi:MAG: hypothetical protein LWW85_00770 [Marinilabiliales bacterium]|nr:hypothetical protein [Marinilabiliales bacterium]